MRGRRWAVRVVDQRSEVGIAINVSAAYVNMDFYRYH